VPSVYQGALSPSVTDVVRLAGVPFNLTGSTVRFRMRAAGGSTLVVDEPAVVLDAAAGQVRYDWQAGDTAVAGDYRAWWSVTLPNTRVQDTPEFDLDVLAHAPSTRLCTVADVRAIDRNLPASDRIDETIDELIEVASDYIQDLVPGMAVADTAASARTFEASGGGVVFIDSLSTDPTLVEVLAGASVTAVTAWSSRPTARRAGAPITSLIVTDARPGDLVRVTGLWGWGTVPRAVRHACVLTVIHWLRGTRALTTQSPDQNDPGEPPFRALPRAAMDILARYQRVSVA
jgi:hypothetical protein